MRVTGETKTGRDIILSNGFSRFQLIVAASELERRGRLVSLITGAYPTARMRSTLDRTLRWHMRSLSRLGDRRDEIPDEKVSALWSAELGQRALRPLGRLGDRFADGIEISAMRAYARGASRALSGFPPAAVYHYRAGFGHRSVDTARQLGLKLLCDHSAPHPRVFEYLVRNAGAMPPATGSGPGPFWSSILTDIERADAVVVNSDFVKRTFVLAGHSASRVHVLYWGLDDAFFELLPARQYATDGPLRLVFAGVLGKGKGANELIPALETIPDQKWTLDIAGHVDLDVRRQYANFLRRPNVRLHGMLRRRDLAELMSSADVFVFPSRAEGSARVVFEALASGCFVVATPNAGSIVEDGVHGTLIPPGDPRALASALAVLVDDRERVAVVGKANGQLIQRHYRQRNYGDGLESVYAALMDAA
jgi:glycosyltransferase involved in cell wall biosynthesis